MEQKPDDEIIKVPNAVKLRYWLDFARGEHREQMRFLLDEAKLGRKPHKVDGQWMGWNNVIKHQIGEAAAVRVLGKALQWPSEQIDRQEKFAFIHDADKHLGVFRRKKGKGDDMSALPAREVFDADEEKAMAKQYAEMRSALDPDGQLGVATSEEFFYQLFERTPGEGIDEKIANVPPAMLLQYYIDSIFDDGNAVPALDFLEKRQKRNAVLDEDAERTRRLGMKYWDAERLVAPKVEAVIWRWLTDKGADIPSPTGVPAFVRREIARDMLDHWEKTHPIEGAKA